MDLFTVTLSKANLPIAYKLYINESESIEMRKSQEAKKKPEKPVLSIEDPIRNKMQTDENSG